MHCAAQHVAGEFFLGVRRLRFVLRDFSSFDGGKRRRVALREAA
jgi:hypothetical protein